MQLTKRNFKFYFNKIVFLLFSISFLLFQFKKKIGYPQPTYRWLKDGMPVTEFSNGQYYRIPNTRREDAGSYQCMARNSAGTIFSEKIDVVVACK